MVEYKTPGVYVEEMSTLPPSVTGVSTAIPAFIGVPAKLPQSQKDALDAASKEKPLCPVTKISSLLEYVELFGTFSDYSPFYESIRLFYANGGDECYIVPAVHFDGSKEYLKNQNGSDYQNALDALTKIDEITLIVLPDVHVILDGASAFSVQQAAIKHCASMKDRFVILDVPDTGNVDTDIQYFRDNISNPSEERRYAAAYYPDVKVSFESEREDLMEKVFALLNQEEQKPYSWDAIKAGEMANKDKLLRDNAREAVGKEADEEAFNAKYEELKEAQMNLLEADKAKLTKEYQRNNLPNDKAYVKKCDEYLSKKSKVPSSGAIAGIYSAIDGRSGVWQAPANVGISSVSAVNTFLSDKDQENMNVDSFGKSINAIRFFSGKGNLVWGARTLDGASKEWRYISVRRLFNYVEESIQESTAWAVFQPNDANTWVKIKCQIDNFLSNLWKNGALAGSTPDQAFFVQVGLGTSMTKDDILDGYLRVNVGLAVVRPTEFVVLTFTHKVQE